MIKDFCVKAVSLAVMAAMLAAPAFGAVCVMSCSESGGGCCCSSAPDGTLGYSAESCCQPEFSPGSSRNTLLPERVAGKVRPGMSAAAAAKSSAFGEFPYPRSEGSSPVDHAASRGRSSPLFVLHSSFLI